MEVGKDSGGDARTEHTLGHTREHGREGPRCMREREQRGSWTRTDPGGGPSQAASECTSECTLPYRRAVDSDRAPRSHGGTLSQSSADGRTREACSER